jgi:multidrug efflux pump subunit AcrA (membrane-fusion protein)
MSKKNRILFTFISLMIIVVILIVNNRINNKSKVESNFDNKEEVINCFNIKLTDTQPLIDISGRVKSTQKINIISEVNGVSNASSIFEVGEFFKKGQVLISIDDSDLLLNLKSVKSQFLALLLNIYPEIKMDFPSLASNFDVYITNFNMNSVLPKLPEVRNTKAKNFLASRQIHANYYSIKSLEKNLEKFKIRAPFDGVLTKTFVDPGSNIIVGQPLGEYLDPTSFEINASVSPNEIRFVKVGNSVIINSNDLDNNIFGKVSRIGSHVNEMTQSIDVFISTSDVNLKDGMFINGEIICDSLENVSKIDRAKILNNNEIFTIDNNSLKVKKIDVLLNQNDSVIIRGLSQKDCIVEQYRNYYYDGMSIKNK